ncbi:MAG TPA: NUDIX domain-containing protein [Candidatus Saccharimonadia bacterium]
MADTDLVDILDETGAVTSQAPRDAAHRDGLLHASVHVWFVTPDRQIIFQRRANDKDTYPGMLDATVGGHVDAGDEMLATALREVHEETGLTLQPSDLVELTTFRVAEITLDGVRYYRTTIPHCSLITLDNIIPQLMERDRLTHGQAILRGADAVLAAIQQLKPHVTRYRPEFRLASKPEKGSQTIVVMADLEHNDEFQKAVGEALGLTIPPRPAHVTLYTLENGKPIGLADQQLLDRYSRPMTDPERAELKTRIPLNELLEAKL